MRNKKTYTTAKADTYQKLDASNVNAERPGEIFSAHIKDLASDGRGVATHPSGRTFFIPGAWEGEKISARITELKGSIGLAECVEIEQASPHRVQPACPHQGSKAGECGGCPWQFVDYKAQLKAKDGRIGQAFSRLGVEKNIYAIHPSAKIFSYRNRAQFKSDGKQLGYISPFSNRIAAIKSCAILSEKNQVTLSDLLKTLPNPQWHTEKKQPWVSLDIDETVNAASVSVNQRLPFMQGNDEQNSYMKKWLAQQLSSLDKNSTVLELFCGSGNLTRTIAEQGFLKITAADVAGEAIARLKQENLPNVHALEADLFSETGLNTLLKKAADVSVLVLDPPREGIKEKGALFSKKMPFKHVYYISCDLATLSRDIALFLAQGYKVQDVQPVDMFPHTPHVEVMVYLRKRTT